MNSGFRDPGGIRTHDPQLRRLLLYPAELRDHYFEAQSSLQNNGIFLTPTNFFHILFYKLPNKIFFVSLQKYNHDLHR